jgi:uncharacterized membrane protein
MFSIGGAELFVRVRAIHIVFGAVALFIAPLAMITVKGGLWHRRWGKIYFWAMAAVALTATIMCWLRTGLFLFLIAILSFYLSLSGYRVLRQKNAANKPDWVDWTLTAVMILAGVGMIVLGLLSENSEGRAVKIAFGLIGCYLGAMDVARFRKKTPEKRAWMMQHMTRFVGAYIATVTAFAVVNFTVLPPVARWLSPTVIGVAGITLWRKRYAKQS